MTAGNGKAGDAASTAPTGQEGSISVQRPAENKRTRPDAATLIKTLAELFPLCFVADQWLPHIPLRVGIGQDLIALGLLKPIEVGIALRTYTRRRMYLAAIAGGGLRWALDGKPAGEIKPSEAEWARVQVAEMDRRQAQATAAQLVAYQASRKAVRPQKPALGANGPRPYHKATIQKTSVRAAQRPGDGLAALKAAAAARRAAAVSP
jgi:sRNA-binding protein